MTLMTSCEATFGTKSDANNSLFKNKRFNSNEIKTQTLDNRNKFLEF